MRGCCTYCSGEMTKTENKWGLRADLGHIKKLTHFSTMHPHDANKTCWKFCGVVHSLNALEEQHICQMHYTETHFFNAFYLLELKEHSTVDLHLLEFKNNWKSCNFFDKFCYHTFLKCVEGVKMDATFLGVFILDILSSDCARKGQHTVQGPIFSRVIIWLIQIC